MNEEYRYFNDAELEKLIAEVETKDMLTAPVCLKDQILSHIAEEKEKTVIQTVSSKASSQRQLFLYSVKIAAAAAAALLVLMSVPMGTGARLDASFNNLRQRQLEKETEDYIRDRAEVFSEEGKNGNTIVNFLNNGMAEIFGQLDSLSNQLK